MLVQYLVGLCCLRRNPDAVDVTIGDLVFDVAASKPRDVDVTITVHEDDGTVRAFKAYEVKREGQPLDVTTVEQLCLKLRDMPEVTHRAIVSASSFTDGAIAKAAAHDIQLLILKPWTAPFADQFSEFKDVGRPDQFLRFDGELLCWVDWHLSILAPDGPPSFKYENSKPVFAADGSVHRTYPNLTKYRDALLSRSIQILSQLDPVQAIAHTFPAEPMPDDEDFVASSTRSHTYTLTVVEDQVFLRFDSGLAVINSVTISGCLQWQRRKRSPQFYILEHVPTGAAFAGAAVADWGCPEGKMFAMIFSPDSSTVGLHTIQLEEKHRNAIRKLKISPQPTPPEQGS
jgi:hypothetical protein